MSRQVRSKRHCIMRSWEAWLNCILGFQWFGRSVNGLEFLYLVDPNICGMMGWKQPWIYFIDFLKRLNNISLHELYFLCRILRNFVQLRRFPLFIIHRTPFRLRQPDITFQDQIKSEFDKRIFYFYKSP